MPAISARQIGTTALQTAWGRVSRAADQRVMAEAGPGRPQYHARCLERGATPDLDPSALCLLWSRGRAPIPGAW